jgi:NAD(P)H-quinone oxidoreductase subunit K
MFSVDSTTAVRGVDKLIPVDVYIPGCPPRPEAIMDAIVKLRKKVSNESTHERGQIQPSHRYYTRPHQMKEVSPILTGEYLQAPERQTPPKELTEAMGMPVPPALKASQKEESSSG